MSLGGRIFAALYDRGMAPVEEKGMADRRARLLSGLRGRVVEIGAGTGANLASYGPGVEELILCEPDHAMARKLDGKVEERRIRVVRAPAESLPLGDGQADAVVCTLVLCTVRTPSAALAEARRVLKPGGRLVFIEHVRAEDPGLARWQDRLVPIQKVLGRGCRPNRDTLAALEEAGWSIGDLERAKMNGAPKYLRPLIAGTAVPPGEAAGQPR